MKYIKKKRNMIHRIKRKAYKSYCTQIRPCTHWRYYYVIGEYDRVNNVFNYKKPKRFRVRTLIKYWENIGG